MPPDAFAVGPKEADSAPEDLVEEEVWRSIVFLPDDVSLRTSDSHGSELRAMHEVWSSWIELPGEQENIMQYAMLDVADELQAAIFNTLCGFYRTVASCLRTALEVVTLATYSTLEYGSSGIREWKKSMDEHKQYSLFGHACDSLHGKPEVKPLEDYLETKMRYSVFRQKSGDKPGGWARKLHSELSNLVHARPTFSSAAMWEGSNGPIYIPSSFGRIYALYLDTAALG